MASGVLHCDETGININSSREWIHSVSSGLFTYYYPHTKRGKEAMDEMGVLPETKAVLIHDHWKAYYRYEGKTHGLCNAHHIRELTGAEEEGRQWARRMIDFLLDLNKAVEDSGGELPEREQEERRKRYRKIINNPAASSGVCCSRKVV